MSNEKPAYLRPPLNGIGIGDYTLHDFAAKWMMQQDDIAEVSHYSAANAVLREQASIHPRIVMFGDSITEFWQLPDVEGVDIINRGIAGQNSSQMLLRFEDDVVSLAPRAVVILCGTNDLRCYVGEPESMAASAIARISRNIMAMVDISKANNIRAVMCTVPPVGRDSRRVSRDPAAIRAVNKWLGQFASSRGCRLADYYSALAGEDGYLATELGEDGVHPSLQGYLRMWPALLPVIMDMIQ
jgi:lysophospholipase L1-like esterase